MRKPVRGEDLFVRKDGTFFPVRYSASPVFRDSVPVGAVIEVQDVTESKAAEEEVRKQAELLSLAHDAIFVRDLESRVIFWNQGAETIRLDCGGSNGQSYPRAFADQVPRLAGSC
jgi:PAS domain-containing protein